MNQIRKLMLAVLLAATVAAPVAAADIESTTWNETAASNNATPPDGWPEGMDYDKVNDAARELMGALKRWHRRISFEYTSGGTADAQTLTLSVAPSAYTDTMLFGFIAGGGLTNTGAATLNVSALGAKSIKLPDGSTDIPAGAITAGKPHLVWYDGTNFRLLMPWLPVVAEGADVDIANTTAETAPATGDSVLIYDTSASANREMVLSDLLKVINSLTEDTNPDEAADFILTYDTSASAVKKVKPESISITASASAGTIIARSIASTASLVTVNSSIPVDDTIPQNSEGVQILTVSHTPAASGNKLLVTASCPFGSSTSGTYKAIALFIDSTANALAGAAGWQDAQGGVLSLSHEYTATGTSAVTFKIRGGITSGNLYVNGDISGNRVFGGVSSCTLTVEEKKA